MSDYEQYLRQTEPTKRKKALLWATSIGLQQAPTKYRPSTDQVPTKFESTPAQLL